MAQTITVCPGCGGRAYTTDVAINGDPQYGCPACGIMVEPIRRSRLALWSGFQRAVEDDDLKHPFEFPLPGIDDSGQMLAQSPTINLALTDGATQTVFSASGSGIVRNIAWIISANDGAATTKLADCTLKVYYDGSGTPTISVPLFAFGGMEYARSAIADFSTSSPAFELSSTPFSAAVPGVFLGCNGNFRLPMPYTNGIRIDVVAASGSDVQSIFFNILHQSTLPSCWNRNLRLCADRSDESVAAVSGAGFHITIASPTSLVASVGSFPSNIAGRSIVASTVCVHDMYVISRTDSTHCVVSSKDTQGATQNVDSVVDFHAAVHQFLNRPAGERGWIAMVVGGYNQPDGDIDALDEGNVRLFLNQNSEQDLEWTSVEDFAMGCYNFEQSEHTEEGGVTCLDRATNFDKTFYRVFYKTPIRYTNGVRGIVPQYTALGVGNFRWTTFYYKET